MFERLVQRLNLSADKSTLAHLLVGYYEPSPIAIWLGTAPETPNAGQLGWRSQSPFRIVASSPLADTLERVLNRDFIY